MRRLESFRRIREEFRELSSNQNYNIPIDIGLPNNNDIFNWRICIFGPENTPYEGGIFIILIHFPNDYPNVRPEIRFKTPIYHLNVNPRRISDNIPLGDICISLFNFWKPEYKIEDVIVSIYALFYMANPDNPYGLERRDEYINNKALYEEKVRYFTRKYAYLDINNIEREYNEFWDFSYNH